MGLAQEPLGRALFAGDPVVVPVQLPPTARFTVAERCRPSRLRTLTKKPLDDVIFATGSGKLCRNRGDDSLSPIFRRCYAMLLPHTLRLIALLLFAAVLVDGATDWSSFYREWEVVFWDSAPDLPSGVFTLLRLTVSMTAAWDGWAYSRYSRIGIAGAAPWMVIMALIGLLYQPVFPLGFGYETWLWLDAAVWVLLATHAVLVSGPTIRHFASQVWLGNNPLNVSQNELEEAAMLGYIRAASVFVPLAASPSNVESRTTGSGGTRSSEAPDNDSHDAVAPSRTSSVVEYALGKQPDEVASPSGFGAQSQEIAARAYPSQKMPSRLKELWDHFQKAKDDPAKTPGQRQTAQRMLDLMEAPYLKQREAHSQSPRSSERD